LARDHTRLTVNGFTALGLVEMTRKRTRESLAHVLCQPCPTCGGRGEVKTARTVAYEILRELLREARQFNAREYRVLAGPAVVDLFLDEESQALALLSDFIENRFPAIRTQLFPRAIRHCSDVRFRGVPPRLTCHAKTPIKQGVFGFR
jgi:Ribonuclease G/E